MKVIIAVLLTVAATIGMRPQSLHAGTISGMVLRVDKATKKTVPVPSSYVRLLEKINGRWEFLGDMWTAKEGDFSFFFQPPAMPEPKEYFLEGDADGYHVGRVFPIIFDGVNNVAQNIILQVSPANLYPGALAWETNHLVITVTIWNQTDKLLSVWLYGLPQSPAITKPWTSFQWGPKLITLSPKKWTEEKLEVFIPPDAPHEYQAGIPDGFQVCLWVHLSVPNNLFAIHDSHFDCILK